ncbi:MAG: 16S rRNA (guanine(527)-N(7))-methyltransferase RsmG [Deltaproteobacteria bacterium]|nr:16S rRNA (guanine(527)-N(7))-methyltransferase RsmG [Deltaproteobacteria bacterium]
MNAKEILISGANELDITLSAQQIELFINYLDILQFWNRKINLTSIKDRREIVIRHFLDSLTIIHFIHGGSRVLDIGSGAGLPGIPLKIVDPSIEITLLDSTQKKVYFLSEVIRKLRLEGISAVCGRAESEDNGVPRSYYNFVISRALGTVDKVIELSVPYIVDDGEIILMRGKSGLEEWSGSKAVSKEFRLIKFSSLVLPYTRQKRVILVVGR